MELSSSDSANKKARLEKVAHLIDELGDIGEFRQATKMLELKFRDKFKHAPDYMPTFSKPTLVRQYIVGGYDNRHAKLVTTFAPPEKTEGKYDLYTRHPNDKTVAFQSDEKEYRILYMVYDGNIFRFDSNFGYVQIKPEVIGYLERDSAKVEAVNADAQVNNSAYSSTVQLSHPKSKDKVPMQVQFPVLKIKKFDF